MKVSLAILNTSTFPLDGQSILSLRSSRTVRRTVLSSRRLGSALCDAPPAYTAVGVTVASRIRTQGGNAEVQHNTSMAGALLLVVCHRLQKFAWSASVGICGIGLLMLSPAEI